MWDRRFLERRACTLELSEVPAKARPRFDRRSGRVYTDSKTKEFEDAIGGAWLRQCGADRCDFTGEVEVDVEVWRPLAKSNPKKRVGSADLMKPDPDNIAKVVCDALNGVAFRDDSQVTYLSVNYNPRTEYGNPVKVQVTVSYYEETWRKG